MRTRLPDQVGHDIERNLTYIARHENVTMQPTWAMIRNLVGAIEGLEQEIDNLQKIKGVRQDPPDDYVQEECTCHLGFPPCGFCTSRPCEDSGIKPGQAEPQEPYAAPTKTETTPETAQGGTV